MSEHKKKKNPAATMMMTSLAYIVLGIVTVVFPQKVLDVLCYALGGAMTVYGLFNIISFFVNREGGMYFEPCNRRYFNRIRYICFVFTHFNCGNNQYSDWHYHYC